MLPESQVSCGEPGRRRRRMMRMSSIDNKMICSTKFRLSEDEPLPELPEAGLRIQVCYAGACSPDIKKCRNKIRNQGLMDTSLFPGYEISGVVDDIGPLAATKLNVGDKVILYPEEDVGFCEGYTEYVTVHNAENVLLIPDGLSMEVAALLPTGGLTAYAACMRANPFIKQFIAEKDRCNILVIGAGGLGLWTTIMATHMTSLPNTCSNEVRVIVADTNTEKLKMAQEHGCFGVIHWPHDAYEEYILDRTRNACPKGVDVVIDFVSSPRTFERGMKVLNKGGILVAGGHSQHVIHINLSELAEKEQSVIGVRRGTREQLRQLSQLVASGQVATPHFNTFPLKDADHVLQGLSDSKIKGRAVLQVSATSI